MRVALVGSPNVGKSVIFNYLTGMYVTVSNYPGTTVDISRGQCRISGRRFEVIDTPGVYSLTPITDEERVTRSLLALERPDLVVHVVDAKNLSRSLGLTLQLIDAGLSVILDLNVMDEAEKLGIQFQLRRLRNLLGIPVVATSAVRRTGLELLKQEIAAEEHPRGVIQPYEEQIEYAAQEISNAMVKEYGLSRRLMALLLLQGDVEVTGMLSHEPNYARMAEITAKTTEDGQMEYRMAVARQERVDWLLSETMRVGSAPKGGVAVLLGEAARRPFTGIPILMLVLYYGLYQFVGNFAAGFLVDYIDTDIFGRYITPWVEAAAVTWIPWEAIRSVLVGDYGIFTLGVRYAAAIILPIIGAFFLVFSLLEDCGYLPRLAMLADGVFRYFGLNGRAVIPVTLGLGCGTMAVMVTRTLETRRERVLATFLLSLAIPCSAQLGLVLALLSHNQAALAIWCGYIVFIFTVVGWLGARLLPGMRSGFYMELPPMRVPVWSNVLNKAYTRMGWYFIEILPVFIAASLLLWLSDAFGVLPRLIDGLLPLMNALGLPAGTAQVFLLGFFRRDYGAAGLYDMSLSGTLSDHQLLVSAITLTLFVPCIAQFVVMLKERGLRITMAMLTLIAVISLASGWLVHNALLLAAAWKGWTL